MYVNEVQWLYLLVTSFVWNTLCVVFFTSFVHIPYHNSVCCSVPWKYCRCEWEGRPCNASDFEPVLTNAGLCYVFNGDRHNRRTVRYPGESAEKWLIVDASLLADRPAQILGACDIADMVTIRLSMAPTIVVVCVNPGHFFETGGGSHDLLWGWKWTSL